MIGGIAIALPREYVAEASLALRFPSLRPETVRLLRLDPTVIETPRYRDPLLSNQPAAFREIARLAADRVPAVSATEVVDSVEVSFDRGGAALAASEVTIDVEARADRSRRAAQLANAYAAALVTYRKATFAGELESADRIDSLLTALRGRRLGAPERRAAARRRAQRKLLADLEPRNLRMTSRATPPDGPRSPRPWRDVRVAAVLGLVLWLTLVAVLDQRARRGTRGGRQARDARNLRTSAASAGSQASS